MKGRKNIAVFGVYPSSYDAECGAADLISAGFGARNISVLVPDQTSLGGALGILAGAGQLAIPGVGPMVAAGPLLAGLAALDVGGALGGLRGTLIGLGIPEVEAKRYEAGIKDGGSLLSVHCEMAAGIKRAKQVLNSSGAEHVVASYERRAARVELAVI